MTDYVLVHDGQILETGRPTRAKVEEPVTEVVDVFNDDDEKIGEREQPVDPPQTHLVLTTVSLAEDSPVDYESLGWTPITEINRDESRAQTPSEIELVEGVPTRTWTSEKEITTDRETIPADGTTVATVTYRFGENDTPLARVDVSVNDLEDDVAVTSAGNAFLEVAASSPGPVDVKIHDLSITILAEEV